MIISNIQLELIDKAKKYLQKNLNKDINVHNSGRCYLCASSIGPGYAILKLWHEGFKNFFYALKIFCQDIISISGLHNYHLINKLEINSRYNKIIVSWGFKNCFLADGSYQDRFFKINSKDIDGALWFLIYENEVFPEKINNNILIFAKSKNKFKYNFFYLF